MKRRASAEKEARHAFKTTLRRSGQAHIYRNGLERQEKERREETETIGVQGERRDLCAPESGWTGMNGKGFETPELKIDAVFCESTGSGKAAETERNSRERPFSGGKSAEAVVRRSMTCDFPRKPSLPSGIEGFLFPFMPIQDADASSRDSLFQLSLQKLTSKSKGNRVFIRSAFERFRKTRKNAAESPPAASGLFLRI